MGTQELKAKSLHLLSQSYFFIIKVQFSQVWIRETFVFGQEKTRGLSEEGFADSKRVSDLLRDVEFDSIVSSTYTRAIQTVQYLAESKGLPIIEFEELRERPIKGLDYKAPWEELLKAIETSFVDIDFALEGGESTRDAQQRSIPIIKNLLKQNRGKNIVIG
ncbi:histidine phosphatase family protein, partial [Paenibacillus sp. TAF58]